MTSGPIESPSEPEPSGASAGAAEVEPALEPEPEPEPEPELAADGALGAEAVAANEEVSDTWEGIDVLPPPYEQVRFVEVVMVLPSTNPIVVLEEISSPRRILRIPIGTPEGVAIGYAARGIPTPKPLTHELFMSVLEAFGMTIDYVQITSVQQNAFTAELVVSGPKGSRTVVCRPSDGIALALRQRLGAPIMVAPEVLDQVGVEPVDDVNA